MELINLLLCTLSETILALTIEVHIFYASQIDCPTFLYPKSEIDSPTVQFPKWSMYQNKSLPCTYILYTSQIDSLSFFYSTSQIGSHVPKFSQ